MLILVVLHAKNSQPSILPSDRLPKDRKTSHPSERFTMSRKNGNTSASRPTSCSVSRIGSGRIQLRVWDRSPHDTHRRYCVLNRVVRRLRYAGRRPPHLGHVSGSEFAKLSIFLALAKLSNSLDIFRRSVAGEHFPNTKPRRFIRRPIQPKQLQFVVAFCVRVVAFVVAFARKLRFSVVS